MEKDKTTQTSEQQPSQEEQTVVNTELTEQILKQKLQKLEQSNNDLHDKFLRARADLDNARKRFLRDRDDTREQAICNVLNDVIQVLDSFTMGLQSVEGKISDEAVQGFQLIQKQLQTCLDKYNVTKIDPAQDKFNPHLHEAVSIIEHDTVPEGNVIQTVRVGYLKGDHLLRPASVIVSSGKKA